MHRRVRLGSRDRSFFRSISFSSCPLVFFHVSIRTLYLCARCLQFPRYVSVCSLFITTHSHRSRLCFLRRQGRRQPLRSVCEAFATFGINVMEAFLLTREANEVTARLYRFESCSVIVAQTLYILRNAAVLENAVPINIRSHRLSHFPFSVSLLRHDDCFLRRWRKYTLGKHASTSVIVMVLERVSDLLRVVAVAHLYVMLK